MSVHYSFSTEREPIRQDVESKQPHDLEADLLREILKALLRIEREILMKDS